MNESNLVSSTAPIPASAIALGPTTHASATAPGPTKTPSDATHGLAATGFLWRSLLTENTAF